jgi:hypothetical protein
MPGALVLSYLDALSAALIARDRPALRELLANPQASELPNEVRTEIDECLTYAARTAPLRTLHFYYQQVQRTRLSGEHPAALDLPSRGTRAVQIELPLSAA